MFVNKFSSIANKGEQDSVTEGRWSVNAAFVGGACLWASTTTILRLSTRVTHAIVPAQLWAGKSPLGA